MKCYCALLLLLTSTFSLAFSNAKLAKGQWAYYGEEFYSTLATNKPFDKKIFNKIFVETHNTVKDSYDVISNQCTSQTCYKHISVGYDQARKIMFGELDKLIDANGSYVIDVYCSKKFYYNNINDVSNMHDRINIEHTWPQSKFNPRIAKDIQKSDMHHLYLSDSRANSIRGNSPFGVVDNSDNRMGGEGCDHSRMGLINGSVFYTPPSSHRGNIARALFYFSMRYSLSIDKQEERVLRLWHKMDPIDDAELKRHEAIAKYQKIRNPFIDHSELVERISDF
jgi:deoxyribonuclease-1